MVNTSETPDDSLWFEDRGDAPEPWLHIGDRDEWYAFRMTPEKARAWAQVLRDFADGKPVPARPAGEERAPWMPESYELRDTPLLAAHRRAEALTDPQARHEARRRLSRSYSAPQMCVEHDGCTIDAETREVVWPDGERWPTRTEMR